MKYGNRFGITALGILMAIGAGSSIANAQTPITAPPPGMPSSIQPVGRDTRRVQRLAADLSLNQAQSVQILSIMRAAHAQDRAIRASTMLTPAQKNARLRRTRRMQVAYIASVLTPPQRMRFREIDLGQ